jgi:hypothetical protein
VRAGKGMPGRHSADGSRWCLLASPCRGEVDGVAQGCTDAEAWPGLYEVPGAQGRLTGRDSSQLAHHL